MEYPESLWQFFQRLLMSSDFMPHGHCYLWRPAIVWLHAISDAAITLAYYSIPLMLGYFVRKRRDLAFNWMFLMFGAFIFLCGTTHLMSVWTLWQPVYRLDGVIKLITAVVSLVTAALLWPLIPKALALPSSQQLEAANEALQHEIGERQRTDEHLLAKQQEVASINQALLDAKQALEAQVRQLEGMNKVMMDREERIIELKQNVNGLCQELGRPPQFGST